ncbi:Bug family tripartite tricarboxylate transporter substrate binding protein [Pigmentiphaga kullae]|uniref:Tripartite-type tricarboxylate transporter receptor subunit TctC n=1 Tax=Pigmentiphaga kullae TaxID=151784 RepID=A0A4Q7NHU4_9BURK|nr:tripartite tricarboxylate transporter substrate binding protein [Pigmentiphaga kullae]RZS84408.1 tripartite-type tricarboxylate transporter receptor subunit TctC [Pigmentiphaga kullae]
MQTKAKTWTPCLLAGWLAVFSATVAAAYPDRPIRLVMPAPPGGTLDALMRTVGKAAGEILGQPLIMDYRPGAAGMLSLQEVAKSQPDGYTLGLALNAMVITPLVQKSGSTLDLSKDIDPISLVASGPMVLFTGPSVQEPDLRSFFDHAKNHQGDIFYGSSGVGGPGHLLTELMARQAGVHWTHVPFKGQNPQLTALLAGDVHLMVTTVSDTVMQYVASRKIKAMAVTTLEESPVVPGVPPLSTVLPGFDYSVWFGMVAAKGTPPALTQRLQLAFAQALQQPEVRASVARLGLVAKSSTQREFADTVAKESALWRRTLKDMNITSE